MKVFSLILAFLLLLVTGFTGYLYLTCGVTVTAATAASAEATTQTETFAEILAQLRVGAPQGTLFSELPEGSAEELIPQYRFVTYHVHLSNTCFIPATTVEVEIRPGAGDILQLADPVQRVLPSRSEGILDAVLLTAMGGNTVRELNVTWYLWGIPFHTGVYAY